MSDLGGTSLGLTQQQAARNIDSETLEHFGKQAARLFGDGRASLNEAVVETIKEAQLSPEQIKRVCEFANTTAYLEAFEKAGSMRNITFDEGPANPSVVIKDLNDGSSPPPRQVKTASYAPPKHYKHDLLEEAFSVSGSKEKLASADATQHAHPIDDVLDLRDRLSKMKDDLMSKYAQSGILLHDVRADLCDAVKHEVMDGSSLEDIGRAWVGYAEAPMWKEAMNLVTGYLKASGMEKQASYSTDRFSKLPSRVANVNHPVVDRFIAFSKIASEHRKLEESSKLVDSELSIVNRKTQELL